MFASTRKLRLFAYTEYREVYPRMGRTIALWGKALSSDPNPQGTITVHGNVYLSNFVLP